MYPDCPILTLFTPGDEDCAGCQWRSVGVKLTDKHVQ